MMGAEWLCNHHLSYVYRCPLVKYEKITQQRVSKLAHGGT